MHIGPCETSIIELLCEKLQGPKIHLWSQVKTRMFYAVISKKDTSIGCQLLFTDNNEGTRTTCEMRVDHTDTVWVNHTGTKVMHKICSKLVHIRHKKDLK